jgi:hypothetical protein
MSGLRELEADFLAFLLSGEARIVGEIVDQAPVGRETRLAIYANAYRIRLRETLETDHEMLGLYLGDDLWDRMVDGYIDDHPSSFRSLRQYGDALPEWLRNTPPFADYPHINELARFERRLLVSFDAADARRVNTDELVALPAARWPDIRLRFHPGVQPFHVDTNCVEIWQALKNGATPPDAASQPDSWWLLWRGEDRLTQFRSLPAEESTLLHHFLAGGDFAGACEQLLVAHSGDDVAQIGLGLLMNWLETGLVRELIAGVVDGLDR